jgi:hypothetical protein
MRASSSSISIVSFALASTRHDCSDESDATTSSRCSEEDEDRFDGNPMAASWSSSSAESVRLLTRRARNASGTATQCTRRNGMAHRRQITSPSLLTSRPASSECVSPVVVS